MHLRNTSPFVFTTLSKIFRGHFRDASLNTPDILRRRIIGSYFVLNEVDFKIIHFNCDMDAFENASPNTYEQFPKCPIK